jgi:uncharacterized membrane protein YdbT with pleckstrin-like domain
MADPQQPRRRGFLLTRVQNWPPERAGRGGDPVARRLAVFLRSGEYVIAMRRHPALLVLPILCTAAGLAGAIYLQETAHWSAREHAAPILIWIAWLLIAMVLVWRFVLWSVTYFVVTADRVMTVRGVFRRRVDSLWLSQLTGIQVRRTIPGLLVGYAQLRFDSPSPDAAAVSLDYAAYADQVADLMSQLAFPKPAPADGADGPG